MTTEPAQTPQPAAVTPPDPSSTTPAIRRAWHSPAAIGVFLAMTLGLLAADLVIKSWSFATVAGRPVVLDPQQPMNPQIPRHQPQVVVPHVLSLWLTTNTGAVFGSAQGARPVFVTVSLLATGVIVTLFLRSGARSWVFHLALAMVLSGALGNLYDRLAFGAVRDMFYLFPDVHLPFGLSWPGGGRGLYPWIFNLADVALLAGVALLGVLSWRYDRLQSRDEKAPG